MLSRLYRRCGNFGEVSFNVKFPDFIVRIFSRKRLSHNPFRGYPVNSATHIGRYRGILSEGKNVSPATTLRHTVFCRVNHPPFYYVAQIGKGGKDYCEIAAALNGGRTEQTVYVFQHQIFGLCLMITKDTVYLPPKHTFFPLYAARIFQCGGYGIVLTRKPSYKHIRIRYIIDAYGVYVFVGMAGVAKLAAVYYRGILPFGRRLPLVVPNRFEPFGSSFQSYSESSDTGEEFDYPDVTGLGAYLLAG